MSAMAAMNCPLIIVASSESLFIGSLKVRRTKLRSVAMVVPFAGSTETSCGGVMSAFVPVVNEKLVAALRCVP